MNPGRAHRGINGMFRLFVLAASAVLVHALEWREGAWQVHPGHSIQEAIEKAARDPERKRVRVHAGVYRPDTRRQAMIWMNRNHDGVILEAVGQVTLTAANPELSRPGDRGHPAVVNHVVYFGDGISSNTILQGFRITGANNFVTTAATRRYEPNTTLPQGLFFFADGGAIKIFGRSYPTLINLRVEDNYASPCAGGISIQHEGERNFEDAVTLIHCVFINNRAQITGAAVDLLPGSSARLIHCLFTGNVANTGEDFISIRHGGPFLTNSAPLTVFQDSKAVVINCTFTGNRNGVDDLSHRSEYIDCIFWNNTLESPMPGGERYAMMITDTARVTGCMIEGRLLDPNQVVSPDSNLLDPPPPDFDHQFVPRSPAYSGKGYRPLKNPE